MISLTFVTHAPLQYGSPTVKNISDKDLTVVLRDQDSRLPNIFIDLKPNQVYSSPYQYYVNWFVEVWAEDPRLANILPNTKSPLASYQLDLSGKVVFIKMDAYALGDNLAWMPYVEEFRKKHDCKIICSTFWNPLFISEYPEILFVAPNTRIDNIFAQYYIGTHDDTPPGYSPSTYITEPLQKIASDILGLEWKEIPAKVAHIPQQKNPKKICISQFASLDMKTWHGDWQKLVDWLISMGYEIHVISKEKNTLQRVIDKSGDIPLAERIYDLTSAQYFIGCSSGLSWLAHSLGCHIFLISDFTPKNHEFSVNTTRIYGKGVRDHIEYKKVEEEISTDEVINIIKANLRA